MIKLLLMFYVLSKIYYTIFHPKSLNKKSQGNVKLELKIETDSHFEYLINSVLQNINKISSLGRTKYLLLDHQRQFRVSVSSLGCLNLFLQDCFKSRKIQRLGYKLAT